MPIFQVREYRRAATMQAAGVDEVLVGAHLPLFFRTLSGQKPSREDMEKLLGIIKGTGETFML